MDKKIMYHIVYKTTNIKNGKYYIGKHSTKNLDDGYLGSGVLLKRAIKKYGKGSFTREILSEHDTSESAFDEECVIVNEDFVNMSCTYNLTIGGHGSGNTGKVVVKDVEGKTRQVLATNQQYLNGDLVGIASGYITVKDSDGHIFRTTTNDTKYLNGELEHHTKNTICVKDVDGNMFRVPIDDPRFLSGELVGSTKNYKASDETKRKMSDTRKGKRLSDEHKESIRKSKIGKPGNTGGRVWINNNNDKRKLIDKPDINYWLSIGWTKGFKYE